MHRGCMIKHCPSPPKAIALASAEAELHAARMALSGAKGFKSLGRFFGEDLHIRAVVDAQATTRSQPPGLGKALHIQADELDMHDALERR